VVSLQRIIVAVGEAPIRVFVVQESVVSLWALAFASTSSADLKDRGSSCRSSTLVLRHPGQLGGELNSGFR